MIRALIVLLVILPSISLACTVPPRYLLLTNSELVRNSTSIVLAKAVERGNSENEYIPPEFTFSVEKTIKGKSTKTIKLNGFEANKMGGNPSDFQGHLMPEFWAFDAGNSIQPGDCSAYGLFELGKSYLLILTKESHPRAYEEIKSEDDLWFKTVQVLVKEQAKYAR